MGFDDANALREADWKRLEALRARFLAGTPGADYWEDEDLVRTYDATFGARIRWKWDGVLAEAKRRGFPGGRVVLDIGCGSGTAGRAYFQAFNAEPGAELILWDRSLLARRTAAALAAEEFAARGGPAPKLVERHAPPTPNLAPDVVLASHLLGELEPAFLDALMPVLESARAIIWVEPGTPDLARRVVLLRERLLPHFAPVAPCPADTRCPLAHGAREREWCHLFATPAPEAFTSAPWRRFSDALGIDLRALPMTYIAMVRRDSAPPINSAGRARPLGRPKLEKGRSLLDLCLGTAVVRARLLDRTDRAITKQIHSRRPFHPLLQVKLEGERIAQIRTVDADGDIHGADYGDVDE